MINVFAATETAFTSNGLAILAPISAVVREQINGEYSLTAKFTQDDAVYIVEDRVLQANTPYGRQLFRISEITATLDGNVEVYALHIFYDLSDYFIEDIYPTAKNGQEALDIILAGTTEAHAFTGYSNITTIQNARIELKSPVTALLQKSEDNCYLNRWGGEIERDNHVVRMLTRKGADRGVRIRYRKNLTGLTAKTDMKTVVTRIMPTGLYEDDTLLELAAKYVDSAHIASYKNIKIVRVHYTDVKVSTAVDALYPTEAAARAELQARAEALFAAGCDLPTMSLDVQLIALADTAEYAQYAALEAIYLGDTVDVVHEPLNVDVSLRLTEYEYDSELRRYIRLTIGDLPANIGTSVIDAGIDISALKNTIEQDVLKRGAKYNAVSISHDEGFVAEATLGANLYKIQMNATDGIAIYKGAVKIFGIDSATGKITITDDAVKQGTGYGGVSISAADGFVAEATIDGKDVAVTMSPAKPFELMIDGIKQIYVSAAGVMVTDRCDVNEDGYVDQDDLDIVRSHILTGSPTLAAVPRMDINGDGLVTASELTLIRRAGKDFDQVSATAPTLENSWVDSGGASEVAGYWVDLSGNVHLRGMVKNGTIGAAIFTMDAGSRPAASEFFPCISNAAFGVLAVGSDGVVKCTVGSSAYVTLSGAMWRPA